MTETHFRRSLSMALLIVGGSFAVVIALTLLNFLVPRGFTLLPLLIAVGFWLPLVAAGGRTDPRRRSHRPSGESTLFLEYEAVPALCRSTHVRLVAGRSTVAARRFRSQHHLHVSDRRGRTELTPDLYLMSLAFSAGLLVPAALSTVVLTRFAFPDTPITSPRLRAFEDTVDR